MAEKIKTVEESKSSLNSFSIAQISPLAQSLGAMLELKAKLVEMQQEEFKFQRSNIETTQKLVDYTANETMKAGALEARSGLLEGTFSIVGGAAQMGATLYGMREANKIKAQEPELEAQSKAVMQNRTLLEQAKQTVGNDQIQRPVAARPLNQAKKDFEANYKNSDYAKAKEDAEALAVHDAEYAQTKSVVDKEFDRLEKRQSYIQRESDQAFNKWNTAGQGFGTLLKGIGDTASATQKSAKAEADTARMVAQAGVETSRSVYENSNRGIQTFSSATDSMDAVMRGMADNNRV